MDCVECDVYDAAGMECIAPITMAA
jgi:hypothetical protein